jgi:hypothetical protein
MAGVSRLDGRGARLVALAIFLAAAGFLAWYERDRLFPPEVAESADPADAAYLACRAARFQDIDAMRADAVISAEQETLFKSRADALCRSQHPPGGG